MKPGERILSLLIVQPKYNPWLWRLFERLLNIRARNVQPLLECIFLLPFGLPLKIFILPKLLKIGDEMGLKDVPIIAGGIFPKEEIEDLKRMGIAEIFRPGSSTETIVDAVRRLAAARHR